MHLVKFGDFSAKLMNHGKIQWAEILVEWHINQILNAIMVSKYLEITYIIDIEKEAILKILWRFTISHPVQSVLDDLDWLAMRREHL